MARVLHRSHHHYHAILSQIREAPLLDQSHPIQLKQLLGAPLSQTRSLFARTPPDVKEEDSSSSGSDSSESSGSNDIPSGSDPSKDTASSSSGAGSKGDKGGVNISIPVALGVVIPFLLAVILFVYLHRRHVRKLRQEDANDPHKSLDFGWDPSANAGKGGKRGKSKKGRPYVAVNELGSEKGNNKDRGLSMDIEVGSPYLLPPVLQGSRESLHSMSRTIHSQDDRYRPATTYNPGDDSSLHSYRTKPGDDHSSSHAGSSSLHPGGRDDMKQDLLGDAQRMSRSIPSMDRSPLPEIQVPGPAQEVTRKPIASSPSPNASGGLAPMTTLDSRDSYQPSEHLRRSNNYLGAFIHSRESSADVRSPETEKSKDMTPKVSPATASTTLQQAEGRKSPPSAVSTSLDPSKSPRVQSLRSSQQASIEHNFYDDGSEYGEAVKVTPASPKSNQQAYQANNRGSSQEYMPPMDEYTLGVDQSDFGYEVQRLSTGVRPLPPEDPNDNPEQRANRIRSFYKEYFDDSKPAPVAAEYYEDYNENDFGGGAMGDDNGVDFVTPQPRPYPQPYGRRAMTPPARIGGRHHAATMSASSHLMPPGSRAFPSVSGQFASGPKGRPPPKKKLPPPKALRVLPTPHMIQEDAFALPIDFAPPQGAKDRQAGVPSSPRGGMRPFSPAVRPHTPLAKSYDDLAVMPSPHLLRRSGTFTALDFAPPPRFKNSDTASDAGSIRSNRSGVSGRTQHAVRAGAYRVSRIPKEVVGTRGDLMDSLKPQWNMHNNTGTIGMPEKLP